MYIKTHTHTPYLQKHAQPIQVPCLQSVSKETYIYEKRNAKETYSAPYIQTHKYAISSVLHISTHTQNVSKEIYICDKKTVKETDIYET